MMLRRPLGLVLLGFLAAWVACPSGRAEDRAGARPEAWADGNLTVRRGLVLWLDAGRQGQARQARGKPALRDGAPVDVWYDASGNGLHLVQRVRPAMPRFLTTGDRAVMRFDGVDDCLALTGLGRTLDDFDVFLAAAPHANPGDFRAFLAINEIGVNDYTTGFTLDLTGTPSPRFDRLNVEGKGFQGAVNLLRSDHPFGEVHVLEARGRVGPGGVEVAVDGTPAGRRDRAPGRLRLDDLTLGARFYSNTADPPSLRGFLDGDVAEVLLYDRALLDEERRAVTAYLRDKVAGLGQALAAAAAQEGTPLHSVADPPPVQMLVPGFTVKELPVNLNNINNVRYRADGKLVALGYDGNVYLLSDSDGDGLEDRAELFWENDGRLRAPIGMALTPPGYRLGDGLFVASKGKLSLIVDTQHRGKADREIVVAEGWKEIPHGVDALGVALGPDGSVTFGLGTADYTNAYLLDRDGKAHYDLGSERGSILRVSSDFSKRAIVCTGIRFSVGLGFNRHGDLFATDQEGATWLANGNPLDELLHIESGRHYGFPPRHPKHLPGVIDEPSVFDYGPQHQSTCGLAFNDPVNGGPDFGPAWWDGDALVTGYSRGKLYRTQLVKTPAGYVARTQLLACIRGLAVDACVSPKGDLVVAVHGGQPDWGSGPNGKGKLYKIYTSDRECPQPVLAWPAGPREVRVAFDRPLDPRQLRDLAARVTVEHGRYVRPGDRFESLRPGYAAVGQQLAAPRYRLPVLGVEVTADRRTLVLATAPHPEAAHYALTLPGLGRPDRPDAAARELPQVPAIDLGYDLSGVTADWRPREGTTGWSGWLPHPQLSVARVLTQASAEHDALWQFVERPGTLTLRCRLDLWHLLRPAVQPGSTLDYQLPSERVTVVLRSPGPVALKTPAGVAEPAPDREGWHRLHLTVNPKEGEPVPIEIELTTGDRPPALEVAYSTQEDDRPRALPLGRVLLPWATPGQAASDLARREVPELAGGSWTRGRHLFFGDEALCSRCHQLGGQGEKLGPDLGNLIHRDYASVLRDIRQPSVTIHPDYITYSVALTDGRVLSGVVRTEGDHLIVGEGSGKETAVRKSEVESVAPSPVSTMPEGLDRLLGTEKVRDLLTFLLTEPLQPAPPERDGAPPPRRRADVEAVLKALPPSEGPRRRLHVVLSAGPKDHGPGEHDYPLWQRRWRTLLELDDEVRVSTATGWPTPEQCAKADLVVVYSANPGWSADKGRDLDAFLQRGGGLVCVHYAVNGQNAVDAFAERIGLAWKGGVSRFRHGPLELTFPDSKHPITRGFEKVRFVDESYWQLAGDPNKVHVLASGEEEGTARPLLWTREQGKGRVFVCVPGHYTWTFDDPLFRVLLLRGMAWAAGEPADRFHPLVFPGATLQDGR
jgi:putative heme-binding domain-containing protein